MMRRKHSRRGRRRGESDAIVESRAPTAPLHTTNAPDGAGLCGPSTGTLAMEVLGSDRPLPPSDIMVDADADTELGGNGDSFLPWLRLGCALVLTFGACAEFDSERGYSGSRSGVSSGLHSRSTSSASPLARTRRSPVQPQCTPERQCTARGSRIYLYCPHVHRGRGGPVVVRGCKAACRVDGLVGSTQWSLSMPLLS